jgi:hypothetical protein
MFSVFRANQIAALVIAVLLGVYFYFALGYRFGTSLQFGPGFFPTLIGILGLGLAFASAVSRAAIEAIGPKRKALLLIAILAMFAALLDHGGFLLVGMVTTAAVMRVFDARRPGEIAVTALLVPVAIWFLFTGALSVRLPEGPLEWMLSSAI